MKFTLVRMFMIISVLVAASLACNLPATGREIPPTSQPLQPQEAEQLEEQLQATLANPDPSGKVTVTMTQQQINGYVVTRLAEQDQDILSNPVVVLTSGQMEVYGTVAQSGITADTKIVLQPHVDAGGNPEFDVVSFDIGPFPAPPALKNRVETMIDESLANYLADSSERFKVETITITEGQMTITGTPR